MADTPNPQDAPRRPRKEYEDHHYHDEDEVAVPPPVEEGRHVSPTRPANPPHRKLPPPRRRFHED